MAVVEAAEWMRKSYGSLLFSTYHRAMSPLRVFAACFVGALVGCDGCTSPTSATSKPVATDDGAVPAKRRRPPLPELPPLRRVESHADGALPTTARLMVPHLAVSDPVTLALRWTKPIPRTKTKADRDWRNVMLDTTTVIIEGDGSRLELTAKAAPSTKKGAGFPFRSPSDELVRVDGRGVRLEYDLQRTWKTPAPSGWLAPGRYRIHLRASIPVQDETLSFETVPLAFEVVAVPSHQTLSMLQSIAGRAAREATGPVSRAHPLRTVEDADGNLWMWLEYAIGGEVYFKHVNLTPSGKVIAIAARSEFTCIARGSSVDTPGGPVAVERLRAGDTVWGWDPVVKRRVATQVETVVERDPVGVIDLDGLRLSPHHPALSARGFVPAGSLAPGDSVRHLNGWREVKHTTPLMAPMVVYDIGVAPPHTFVARGLVVHNKAAPTEGPADGWAFLFDRPHAAGWQHRRWFGRPSPRQIPSK